MPHFHPSVPPHFLSERMRDAERAVWETFQQLDYSWHVFYSARENSQSGWDREIDFVLIRLNRIFYCEVKGGVVIVDQRAGAGVTWAHFKRSGEPVAKRADPKQLWLAKLALSETIRKIAGQSPRDLGFREHNFYIFPHTPKDAGHAADLERGNTHYAFAEDISGLPQRLHQIATSGKGRFIRSGRIASIIESLDATVIKGGGGTLPPQPRNIMPPAFMNDRIPDGLSAASALPAIGWPRQFGRVIRRYRLYAVAALLVVLMLPLIWVLPLWGDAAKPVPGLRLPTPALLALPTPSALPPTPTASTSRPIPARSEADLPAFISAASTNAVEQAIAFAMAQKEAVSVSWQNETHQGFVTWQSDEGNGCRRYRVSRNDVQPIRFGFIRRCS